MKEQKSGYFAKAQQENGSDLESDVESADSADAAEQNGTNQSGSNRVARIYNGEDVTDSESDVESADSADAVEQHGTNQSGSNRVGRIYSGVPATSVNQPYAALIVANSDSGASQLAGAIINNTQVLTSASGLLSLGNITSHRENSEVCQATGNQHSMEPRYPFDTEYYPIYTNNYRADNKYYCADNNDYCADYKYYCADNKYYCADNNYYSNDTNNCSINTS
ncbi:hypothetical protein AND_007989 [Anopheles darlingi]|uniref:Uncharacterized protein n=1 Tax=Anopheles darlingi TaxID=43151 RepID=W5J8W2_ANODA|nr:hypothetical protein AND_007989 [Anopheles darlingi]